VVQVSDLAAAVLRAVQHALVEEPRRALTVAELTDALGVDRSVLDAELAELDDAGLIRVRGDVSTQRSSVQLTDAGLHALDGSA
jgi:DNA-binding MarR family transcriptional regulator